VILPLVKITICGLIKDKGTTLADLQEMGCLHVIPLTSKGAQPSSGGTSSESRDALKFLLSCAEQRRQALNPWRFDPKAVEHKALELRRRIQTLEDERDVLRHRIMDLRPWGDFALPPPEDLGDLKLWFYIIPHREMKNIPDTDIAWEIVGRDNRFCYVVVISEEEPRGMPSPRTHTGTRPLSELERRLEEVEFELEDSQAERSALTRWCTLFSRSLDRLQDEADRLEVGQKTYDEEPVFALQAWAPRESIESLQSYSEAAGFALDLAEPEPTETPPTLLRNQRSLAVGQDLVSFYTIPNYWGCDPSTTVLISFALFFGMIMADAGYGLILGLGLALGWRRMGRSDLAHRLRILFAILIAGTLVYGVLVGSYFGLTPHNGTLLSRIKVFDLNNFGAMMRLSVTVGVTHLVLANAVDAWHQRHSIRALAPFGWVLIFVGAYGYWTGLSGLGPSALLKTAGLLSTALGGAGVFLFTEVEGGVGRRLVGGLHGLSRLSGAFGDTLSYLRLFALGLASAALATSFNGLAQEVRSAFPGLGILFGLLIVVLGHGLNILLGISSGFIHGLRLNFIEFFNWSVPQEGYSFKAFERKEKRSWSK
jgi:V/A-type H+-transporting ATPase subunit I